MPWLLLHSKAWRNSNYRRIRRPSKRCAADHEITATGSIHEQGNKKVLRTDGKDKVIVKEKGLNTYDRTDESKCTGAALEKEIAAILQQFAANKDMGLK